MFKKLPSGYILTEDVDFATIELQIIKLTESRDTLSGILSITVYLPEKTSRLYLGKFNVLSSQTRSRLASYIAKISPNTLDLSKEDWHALIEKFSQKVIEAYYQPEMPEKIEPLENVHVNFLLYPLLPEAHPVLMYAPGGSGKSLLAMYISMFVQNGISWDGEYETKQGNVLYVDWEVDKREAQRRFGMIKKSFEADFPQLDYPYYKRALLNLKDEIDDILLFVVKKNVTLVIIDSAGPAVGGELNNAEKVIEFFSNVRKITSTGATCLILTHVAKAEKNGDERSPLGSVYFENLSRLTWEVKYELLENKVMDFALIPRKSNFGKLPSVGLRAVFDFGGIYFTQVDAEAITNGTIKDLILGILVKNSEGMTARDLANVLGIKKDKIYVHLSKLKKQGKVDNTGDGRWVIAE